MLLKYIRKEDGFRGERFFVVPREVTDRLSSRPIYRELLVTDIGFYPRAAGHQKSRKRPIEEGVLLLCVEGSGFVRCRGQSHNPYPKNLLLSSPGNPPYLWLIRSRPVEPLLVPSSWRSTQRLYSSPPELPEARTRGRGSRRECGPPVRNDPESNGRRILSESDASCRPISCSDPDKPASRQQLFSSRIDRRRDTKRRTCCRGNGQTFSRSGEAFDLTAMAVWARLSVPHFTVLFKKRYGYTPVEYFSRLRIQQACRLLEFSERTVGEIARSVGFTDQYYFSRVFKKIMGASPANFRKETQAE